MCGFAAIIGSDLPQDAISSMVAALRHRGPDAQGIVELDGCAFGHARLSIIDIAGGGQPMVDAMGRYWITFNGEIYNFRELRSELEMRGCRFRTRSDTETILEGYRIFGKALPTKLNGQFAFAIWDTETRHLFAARDRMGEKPFYLATAPSGQLILASEIKAIIASRLLRPRIDRDALNAYLGLLYVPPDRSIFEEIRPLRPGHYLTWSAASGITEVRYWNPCYSTLSIHHEEAVAETQRLLTQAVRRQAVADVPLGAFVSGGLDSSTIVALLSEAATGPVQTFSAGFGSLIDELPYARAVADKYKTEHHELQVDFEVGPMLERMAEVYDEPFADSSNIPTYLIAEFARKHVTVVLTGDGGDELFGGYEWYLRLFEKHDEVSPPAIAARWAAMIVARGMARARLLPPARRDFVVARWDRASPRNPDPWARHVRSVLLQPANANRADLERYRPDASVSGLDRAVDFDVRCYLPGDILVKVDRASMAHGLESRAPFLDVELVEFVLGLPAQLRFADGIGKKLLSDAFADRWPSIVRGRKKQGFGGPVAAWLERPDVRALIDRVSKRGAPLSALLPRVVDRFSVLGPHERWALLGLGLWLERREAWLR
jgi:asparagine synthase (glutamine-hydrolysing)